jgi:transposase
LHGGVAVLTPLVIRVVTLQVKAIAHAHVETDKVDVGTLASLYAAGYLAEIWTPDAATERRRQLVARRYQMVRRRTLSRIRCIRYSMPI